MGDSDWLICPRPNPRASVRLICLPHAGGGASAFRAWAEEGPGDLEMAAVQLPGREGRWKQKPFTSHEALIPVLGRSTMPSSSPRARNPEVVAVGDFDRDGWKTSRSSTSAGTCTSRP